MTLHTLWDCIVSYNELCFKIRDCSRKREMITPRQPQKKQKKKKKKKTEHERNVNVRNLISKRQLTSQITYLDSSVSGKKKMSTTRTMPPITAASSEGSMNGKRPKNPSSENAAGYRTAGFAK